MDKAIVKNFLTTIYLVICMFEGGSLLGGTAQEEYIWEITGTQCNLEFQYSRREFVEKRGVQISDAYKHYRVSREQIMCCIGPEINKIWRISGLLGMSDLELHCSEGETRKFDFAFLLGVDTELFIPIPDEQFMVSFGGRFLTFSANNGRVTDVIQHMDFVVWNTLDLQWRELTFTGKALLNISDITRIFSGLEYSIVELEEEGTVFGVERSGKLQGSDKIGVFFGLERKLNEVWSLCGSVNIIDRTAFVINFTGRF